MLLEEWELIDIVNQDQTEPNVPVRQLKILNFKEKDEWELLAKYNIGNSSYEK